MALPSVSSRHLGAIGGLGVSLWLFKKAATDPEPETGLGYGMLGMIGIMISAALLTPEIYTVITRVVDGLYFPGGKLDKPILSYKLPEFYRKEERLEESLEQYDIILEHYPREVRAWIGAIELLIEDFGNRRQAEDYYLRARRKLRRNRQALDQLEQCWRSHSAASTV